VNLPLDAAVGGDAATDVGDVPDGGDDFRGDFIDGGI
jgi:hypothetical protein